MKNQSYYSLGDAIRMFLEKRGLSNELAVQKLINDWGSLMGKPIAANTEKMWFHAGILYIKMLSPVWVQELSLAKSKIQEMANKHIGKPIVKEVRIF